MTTFSIQPNSPTPAYMQILNQINYAIASGHYAPDEQLPSVRQLAVDLLVNPTTVAKAYRELERGGLTYSRKGRGVFVADLGPKMGERHRLRSVTGQIADAINEAVRSGLKPERIRAITESILTRALGKRPTLKAEHTGE